MKIQKNTKYKIQAIGQLVIKKPSNKSHLKPCHELRDLKDTNCYIDDLKFKGLVKECFNCAIEGKFKSLSMKRNQSPQIIKELSHIKFTSLRVLELNTNKICNIQALGWLNALNLRCLDLQQNLISNCKPLAKLFTVSLSQLKIGKNLFADTQNLTRMRFKTNEFSRDLSLNDINGIIPYNKIHFSVTFLAKLQEPKDLDQQWISINKIGLLKPRDFQKCIKRKHTKQRSLELSMLDVSPRAFRRARVEQPADLIVLQ